MEVRKDYILLAHKLIIYLLIGGQQEEYEILPKPQIIKLL